MLDERILCESPLVRVTAHEGLEPCEHLPRYAFHGSAPPMSGALPPGDNERPVELEFAGGRPA